MTKRTKNRGKGHKDQLASVTFNGNGGAGRGGPYLSQRGARRAMYRFAEGNRLGKTTSGVNKRGKKVAPQNGCLGEKTQEHTIGFDFKTR